MMLSIQGCLALNMNFNGCWCHFYLTCSIDYSVNYFMQYYWFSLPTLLFIFFINTNYLLCILLEILGFQLLVPITV